MAVQVVKKNEVLKKMGNFSKENGAAVILNAKNEPEMLLLHFPEMDADKLSAFTKNIDFNLSRAIQIVAQEVA